MKSSKQWCRFSFCNASERRNIRYDVNLPDIEKLNILAKEMFEILGRYNYGVGGNSARILRNYHRYLWKTSIK